MTIIRLSACRMLQNPMAWVEDRRARLERQGERLGHSLTLRTARDRENFARLCASMDALSPLKVLSRGYAVAKGPHGLVKSVGDVSTGEELSLTLSDGALSCTVDAIQNLKKE